MLLGGRKEFPWFRAAFFPGPLARQKVGSAQGFRARESHGSPQWEGLYAKAGIRKKPKATQAAHSHADPSLTVAPASVTLCMEFVRKLCLERE